MAMWFEGLPAGSTWSSLWHGYTICGRCSGIRAASSSCPACGDAAISGEPYIVVKRADGREIRVAQYASMGAEGRFEDYIYLQMLQREWDRPAPEFEQFSGFAPQERPSARAALVLLF
jgi:hypothetical protein